MKCLLRDGLLGAEISFFDYGCGRGEDLELLSADGVTCSGWDPAFRPEAQKAEADVVNLGYVLNVIEDPEERATTLRAAWGLCRQVLAVSAQVLVAGRGKTTVEFGDGVLTGRNTFQKFYEQSELKTYLESQLEAEAIPAGIGTYYLIKDEGRKQQFLANRFRRREILPRRRIAEMRLEDSRQALEPLMEVMAGLGRLPDPVEFPGVAAVIERFGSLKRAFAVIQRITDTETWEEIVELKVEKSTGDRVKIAEKYTAQPTQYAGSEARQVSIALVLDLTKKVRPPGDIRNDILLVDVPTHGGAEATKVYPSKAFVFVVNGNTRNPSSYS